MQVMASDDGGLSWQRVGSVGPLWWPQAFRCASGVYVLGTVGPISLNNDVIISRMLDLQGERCADSLCRHVWLSGLQSLEYAWQDSFVSAPHVCCVTNSMPTSLLPDFQARQRGYVRSGAYMCLQVEHNRAVDIRMRPRVN